MAKFALSICSLFFLTMVTIQNNLSASFSSYDQAKRGYELHGQKIIERYRNIDELEIFNDLESCKLDETDSLGRIKMAETFYVVQLPTYKEADGSLVKNMAKWERVVSKDIHDKVVAIVNDNINDSTVFPVQIDTSDGSVCSIMKNRTGLYPIFMFLSWQEKIEKDEQAAYATFSILNKIKYSFFDSDLPDPYQLK